MKSPAAWSKSMALLASLAVAGCPMPVQGATIASWNLYTTDGGATNPATYNTYSSTTGTGSVAPGITNADITRNGSLTYSSASFGFNSAAWDGNAAENIGVGFTVNSGGPWDVTDFIFGIRSSATGPGPINVSVSVDGGPSTLFTTLNATTSYVGYDLHLNDTVNSSLVVQFSAAGTNTTGGADRRYRDHPPRQFQRYGRCDKLRAIQRLPSARAGIAWAGSNWRAGVLAYRRRRAG